MQVFICSQFLTANKADEQTMLYLSLYNYKLTVIIALV